MTVKRMMNEMDSVEFSKWIAYERIYGPVGPPSGMWQADALSSIHEQLQLIAYLISQAKFTGKHKKRGPIPPPTRVARPHEALFKQKPEDPSDYNSEEWQPPEPEECPPNCVCKVGKDKQIAQATEHVESSEGQEE